jgi:hypothetical protein
LVRGVQSEVRLPLGKRGSCIQCLLKSGHEIIRIARQIRKPLPHSMLPTHGQQAFCRLVTVQHDQITV